MTPAPGPAEPGPPASQGSGVFRSYPDLCDM
jgi:hypothetical protein